MSDIAQISENSLQDKLLKSTTKKELEEVVSLINLDLAKKNILRSTVFSDTVDKVLEEIVKRVDAVPGQFSNKDLLDYLNVLQNHLSKSTLENKEIPTIAIQQNIVLSGNPLNQFDKESKDRMRQALQAILKTQRIDEVIIDESSQEKVRDEGSIPEQIVYDETAEFESGFLE